MTTQRQYDITSPQSIRDYARQLKGKTLSDLCKLPLDAQNARNKGMLGNMVEEYFYEYMPGANRFHEPDFSAAGVELKVTGVIPNRKAGDAPYKAKERLVLTMISYMNLAEETWGTSSFLKKCRLMLLLFYLYEKELPPANLRFVMDPLLWDFPEEDLQIIEKDWNMIRDKVMEGKAHEISEGDTFYLGACRKGSGGTQERLREQPYSDIPAKARAFSLKQSYLSSIINNHWKNTEEQLLIEDVEDAVQGIEKIALSKFRGLSGRSVEELIQEYGLSHDAKSKSIYSALAHKILGAKNKTIPEFEKAGVVMKTIRLQVNGMPKEAMSFPAFDYFKLVEQDWEDSDLHELLAEKKFFFVVYQYDKAGILRFKKVMFWNMPYEDRLIAHMAWSAARKSVQIGDMSLMPKASENLIVHVRPHGANKMDMLPLPGGGRATKRCFWLNQKYISRQLA